MRSASNGRWRFARATDLDGPLNVLVGANYSDSQSRALRGSFTNDAVDNQAVFGSALTPELVGLVPNANIRFYPPFVGGESENEFDSVSAFTEMYWTPQERFTVTLGLRYNRDRKHVSDRAFGTSAADVSSSGFFGESVGPGPVFVRFFETPDRLNALLDLYGAREAFEGAGTLPEQIEALQIIPIVPQLNEDRILAGVPDNQTWDAWTGRIVLDWQTTDQTMLYAKYSRGYKPGGFNPGSAILPFQFAGPEDAVLTYHREDVDAFEVGAKALMLDGTLALDVAAFYNDYQNLQLAETGLEVLSSGPVNTNVDAEMFGAELELRWRPIFAPRAEVQFGYAWLDTSVKNLPPRVDPVDPTGGDPSLVLLTDWQFAFADYVAVADEVLPFVDEATSQPFPFAWGADRAPGAQYANGIPAWFDRPFLETRGVTTFDGVPVRVSGNRLPESPEHSVRIAASYTWDVPGGALTARWDYYWQDDAYMTIFNRPSYRIDSWDRHDAMLAFESRDNRWSVRAWVQNISNDVHIVGGLRSNDPFFSVSDPRIYGASFRYNFGG